MSRVYGGREAAHVGNFSPYIMFGVFSLPPFSFPNINHGMSNSTRIPNVTLQERTNVNPSTFSAVDAFLKPLKTTCRRLHAVSTTLSNEEQLLNRVFYKGKNQHRSALFWRKAADLRRFAERVRRLKIAETADALRFSFFGEGASAKCVFCPRSRVQT